MDIEDYGVDKAILDDIRSTFGSQPIGLYIFDLQKQTNLIINDEYSSITGWNLQEVNSMGEQFLDLFHPDDKKAVLKHMQEVASSDEIVPYTLKYRFKHKEGHYITCMSYDTPFDWDTDGKLLKFVGAFVDITK